MFYLKAKKKKKWTPVIISQTVEDAWTECLRAQTLVKLSGCNFLVHNLGQHTEPWPSGNNKNTNS